MRCVIYFDRGTRAWWGYWTTRDGDQIGDAISAHSRDECLIELGAVRADRLNQQMAISHRG